MQAPDILGEQVPGPVLLATNTNQVVMMADLGRVAQWNQSGAELQVEKEPVGKQAIPEGGLQQTGENDQEHASNGIDTAAEGLLADILDKQTNMVDPTMQHTEEQGQLHDVTEGHEMSSNGISSGSDSGSSSGSELDTELGKCFYPSFEALESSRPPEVGMKFPTLEDAERFYSTHALLTGFAVRRGSNYRRKKFHLLCNRSGKLKPTQDLQRKRKNNVLGSQCQARVIVKLHQEQWEIIGVKHEHNHPLCPHRSLTKFFLDHKYLSSEEKSFLRVLQQSRVNPRKAMKIFRRMRSNLGNTQLSKEKDMRNLQCVEQWRKENSDVETALKRFKELELRNLGFSYTMQTDEDNVVRSLFWTDARSRVDYEIFGDFVSFDTTYSTNRHNMPFTPIIGMNNHGRILLFGCALLQDQKAETFKWMFQAFLHVMGGKMPRAIITSQDEGMTLTKAIAEVMPQVSHRFCKFSVMRKAHEMLGAFMAARGNINAELHSLVDNSLKEKEFEDGWAVLIDRYDASENEYLRLMWETRKKWAPVYLLSDFYPFVELAGHGEGKNLLFKDNVLPKDRIEKFIEQYERMQENIIKTEEEDTLQSATEPAYFSMQPIEKHAAHIYTRQIFLRVQKELYYSTAFNVHEIQGGSVYRLEKVSNYENPEFDRNSFEVVVEAGTHAFKCQCAKFTRDGILCCHILRVFTQLGVNEIPAQYILPRWTRKFREEQLKEYEEKCLKETENKTRYAMLLSKMADIGKGICTDGAKCSCFMLELDKIQKGPQKAAPPSPLIATVRKRRFLGARRRSTFAAGEARVPPPPSAAPAAGGWGKPVSRRVYRVGLVGRPASAALEVAVVLVGFAASARLLSGGGAPWSSTDSRATVWSREIVGFPPLRLSRPDPGAADLGDLQREEEEAAAGVRGVRDEDLGCWPQSWSGGCSGDSPGRCSSVCRRSISTGMVVVAAHQRLRARSSSALRGGAGGWFLLRRRRWRTAAFGVAEVEDGLVLQCLSLSLLCSSLSLVCACLLFRVVLFLV